MAELAGSERALRRVLWEMREYLSDLVLIGGWVPYLYRRYGGFKTWRSGESLTNEVDLLTDADLPAEGRAEIAEQLRAAGFEPAGQSKYAAVWLHDPEKGERIEFFVSHSGPAKTLGSVRPIGQQPGVGAISLEGLSFLQQHSRCRSVSAEDSAGDRAIVEVTVPLLGAFVVNKAVTFPRRPGASRDPGEFRRAKDLLYLRDLMAAGVEVTEHIEAEVASFREAGAESLRYVETAVQNLRLVREGQWASALHAAAKMLVERGDAESKDKAVLDVKGHLDDLQEMLAGSA
jgi:hypothetical protein